MTLTIDVPDNEYLSANDRLHWRPERNRKKALRSRGHWHAKQARLEVETPVLLVVDVGLRTGGRADPENAAPTVKCLVDGLVDAGALTDDDSAHIVATTYRRGPKVTEKGIRRITLTFVSQHIPF